MADYGELKERVAIITGGGQGLGRAFALAFAAQGAIPVIADMNADRAESVAEEVRQMGGQALAVHTDVSDVKSVQDMADAVMRTFGRIDILINNAAIFSTLKMRPFYEIPIAEWNQVLDVNINGALHSARAVCRPMMEAGWGRIINVSSASVKEGRANYMHYTTSKSALIGMTRSMARELGSRGITVNALLPGATLTEVERETVSPAQMEQMVGRRCIPREETAGDLVGTVLFLASDAAAFLTGQCVTVDGGMTHS
ncbi:short-chain dehydrogenase [Metarhizobium album]|uniref:Short-chain dehydrogenase n=1 Tax=Metarhizobium album TaxID=2182425 RepID=A0A2U2DJM4_9HYPH|nr:3-oxoacyl-ACP reductase family protein [Rhizobium album]PWE53470.1 short-chain dehydrogenase [Rhizobium album]